MDPQKNNPLNMTVYKIFLAEGFPAPWRPDSALRGYPSKGEKESLRAAPAREPIMA